MDLLIVRHAVAEDRDAWAARGEDDRIRPLTKEGKQKMRRAAVGLRVVVPEIDVLASSPLVRAQQTASILSKAYDGRPIETVEELAPEHEPPALRPFLRAHGDAKLVAIVGHDPHLSSLIAWLVAGRREIRLELKKGAACLVSFDAAPRGGNGTLRWLLAPSQLRRLGD